MHQVPARRIELVDGSCHQLLPQHSAAWGEQKVQGLIQQPFDVQLLLAGRIHDQILQPVPAEILTVKQHVPQGAPQIGIGILQQAASEIGIGRTEDFEIAVDAEGNAFQRHQ